MSQFRIFITMAAFSLLAIFLAADPAQAQMLGANTLGDYGLQSATQPPPGFTLVAMYYHYNGNELVDSQGNEIAIDPQHEGALDANAYVLGGWYVTRAKLFGGNYGFMVYPAFSNTTVQAPILDLTSTTGTGFSDLYIQPINLGWHTDRADILAGLAVTAPTGRYSPGADDNIGMGMWSYEVSGGATLYFDQAKTFSFATMAYFEFHSEKEGSDQKVGNILTLEGGLGKAFYGGGLTVGAAYYAQWKLSQDQLGAELEAELAGLVPGKSRGYGFGPEVVAALTSSTKYLGSISLRYLWETGVRTSIKGGTFCLTATFPIPSMSLQ